MYLNTGRILEQYGVEVIYFSQQSEHNQLTKWSKYFYKGPKNKFQLVFCNQYNFNSRRQLKKLLKDIRPDIAHIHELGNMSLSIYGVLKKNRIPIVQTVHDYHFVCPVSHFIDKTGQSCEKCKGGKFFHCFTEKCSKGNSIQSLYMWLLFRFYRAFSNPTKVFDGMVYVSGFSMCKNLEHYPELASVQHTFVYNSAKETDHDEMICRGDYFLYFGRLSREKGVDVLISAFIKSRSKKLYVVGTGPLEQSCKQNAADSSNIIFTGYKSGKELEDLIRNCSYVVVPSICYENNPMAVVEAYSYGKPVIGSKFGAIQEVVFDKQTGFLFEKDNDSALCSAVLNASDITDSEYCTLCDNAYTFYRNNFRDDQYVKSILAFYDKIMNNDKQQSKTQRI